MRYVSIREHNGTTVYGYSYTDVQGVWWSMRWYPECWHAPLRVIE